MFRRTMCAVMKNPVSESGVNAPWNRRHAIISLWDMKEYPANRLTDVFDAVLYCYMKSPDTEVIRKQLPLILRGLEELELTQSKNFAETLKSALEGGSPAKIVLLADTLQDVFETELRSIQFLRLEESEAKLWKSAADGFGTSTEFPGAQYDCSEAIRCRATGRHTACVLHCMRALEFPIRALCMALNVPFKNNAWQATINTLQKRIKEIDQRKRKPNGWKTWGKQFHSEALTHLWHIKDAWRNHAMHAMTVYSSEDSEMILTHTRHFMQHLAKRLKQAT